MPSPTQALARGARTNVIAWYRQPTLGQGDVLPKLSAQHKEALERVGTLAIQVGVDAVGALGNHLIDTYIYNELINESSDAPRSRWNSLMGQEDALGNPDRARAFLRATQQRLRQQLPELARGSHYTTAEIASHMAALFVPPPADQLPPDAIWLPDTSIAMPSGRSIDGTVMPITAFPAEAPPRASYDLSCR